MRSILRCLALPILLMGSTVRAADLCIVQPADASPLESLAARELRRYLYLRTGAVCELRTELSAGPAIVLGTRLRESVRETASRDVALLAQVQGLGPQQYRIRALHGTPDVLLVAGGDALGVLYGAYRVAEHLGCRFYLHGDVIPDTRIPLALPEIDDVGKPLFATRGIQPFHDFPEGPDWWNLDDYKAVVSQLPKLRMNFIGFHCYPSPEPLVWIGPPEHVDASGRPLYSYPAGHATTVRGSWGYDPRKTSDYVFGADQLFDRDDYGADYMRGMTPMPDGEEACNELFARVGTMLDESFSLAERLGVKTCIGTETPLRAPASVRERLAASRQDARSRRPLGGRHAAYQNPIADTEDDPVYQTVRYDLNGYQFTVPNGVYSVTLLFSEVAYTRKGARVFGVTIEDKQVIDRLDIWEKVGKDRALDYSFKGILVTDGRLDIGFVKQVEYPCIAGIVVRGAAYSVKVNCAGGPHGEFVADEGAPFLDPQDTQKLYEGMFLRIMRTHPLDYYWLWTPEGWTWQGASDRQVSDTVQDLQAALAALQTVKAPFSLATCGWVLGPPQDRALFDKTLPASSPMSCISRQVGWAPVEPGFSRIEGRPKWAIPWLEDDPGQTIPQLWVGRMRRDAADALAYGCTGLMGIHWRTRILGPNVSALAAAAWDQSGWNTDRGKRPPPAEVELPEGADGGSVATFADAEFADTGLDALYRTVRYGMKAYRLSVPNGLYTVTLHLAEPHYTESGSRVFGIRVQGRTVTDGLDMFAKVGKNRAIDMTVADVRVDDGRLAVDFVPQTGSPCIAAVAVTGLADPANQFEARAFSRKINCGGAAWRDYEADLPVVRSDKADQRPRDLPAEDFYLDWATALFGSNVGPEAAALFAKLDGGGDSAGKTKNANLPRPATWVAGPGGIQPDGRPWTAVAPSYSFVDELAALRPHVQGAGSRERFDFWLDQFRYIRAMGEHNCVWAQFEAALKKARGTQDAAERARLAREEALPLYERMVQLQAEIHAHLLATVTTPGGMGNVMNWQQHILFRRKPKGSKHRNIVTIADSADELAAMLGGALPAKARPATTYSGPPRLFVPTVRGSLEREEDLKLTVIMLGIEPTAAVLRWRRMGLGTFQDVKLMHVARGVYRATVPTEGIGGDIEYHIAVRNAAGETFRWPSTAPDLCQTVIVW